MRSSAVRQLAVATLALGFAVARPGIAAPTDAPAVLGAVSGHGVRSVEVVVLDRDGRAVPGLEAADFRLSIDGQPVPIVSFAGPERTAVETGGGDGAVPAAALSTLAVFFDEASLSASARDRALAELAAEASRSLAPGCRLMLVASHGTGIDLLLQPSAEPSAIAAGFAAARNRPLLSTRGSELRQLLSAISSAANPNGESDVEQRLGSAQRDATLAEVRQYMARRQREALDAVAALDKLVEALGGVPGRRAVLVVSGGLSSRPGQGPLGAWANRFQSLFGKSSGQLPQLDTFDRGTDAALATLAERANRAGVTLYGLGLADVAGGAELTSERVWSHTQQDAERGNVGQALARLATLTGGTAVENPGDLGGVLRRAQSDAGAAYTLGWEAGADDAATRQRLEIVTRDPELAVRHRSNVPPRESGAGLRDLTLAALLFGSGDNALDLKLQVESVELPPIGNATAKGASTVLQLVVTLPLARLSLLPRGGLHEGGLHLLFGSLDAGGRLSDLQAVEAPIRIANDQLLDSLAKLASYRVRLTLRPVAQRLAVGVLDDVGRVEATTTLEWSPSGSESLVLQ